MAPAPEVTKNLLKTIVFSFSTMVFEAFHRKWWPHDNGIACLGVRQRGQAWH